MAENGTTVSGHEGPIASLVVAWCRRSLRNVLGSFDLNHCFPVCLFTCLGWSEASAKDRVVYLQTALLFSDSGDMLTNRHVIEKCDPQKITVRMSDGRMSCAKVMAVSRDYDLRLFRQRYGRAPLPLYG
jgi:S1-C subfamily serine protease